MRLAGWGRQTLLLLCVPAAFAQSFVCPPPQMPQALPVAPSATAPTVAPAPPQDLAAVTAAAAEVRQAAFPELSADSFQVRQFRSASDYFRTRFSLWRFFLPVPMRYTVQVNPRLFAEQAPVAGVCGILAHELAHVVALRHGNRIRRLGLVRLLGGKSTRRFERGTDLEAIQRGYAAGLKDYRSWIYAHIPARDLETKRRRYFTPEEIDAIEKRLREEASALAYFRRHVPLNLAEIQAAMPSRTPPP
jgi:hypothetical protein